LQVSRLDASPSTPLWKALSPFWKGQQEQELVKKQKGWKGSLKVAKRSDVLSSRLFRETVCADTPMGDI